MGRSNRALSGMILLVFLLTGLACMGSDLGMHAKIRTFMMPQYQEKNQRLQFIVYGKDANNKGARLELTDLVVDFISNDVKDVREVVLIPSILPYALSDDVLFARAFWSGIPHSQGLIFCETATLDKTTQTLSSGDPVQFRSEYLDVNGIGFDAFQDKRLLHIRKNVKMKLRMERTAGKGKKGSEKDRKSVDEYLKD